MLTPLQFFLLSSIPSSYSDTIELASSLSFYFRPLKSCTTACCPLPASSSWQANRHDDADRRFECFQSSSTALPSPFLYRQLHPDLMLHRPQTPTQQNHIGVIPCTTLSKLTQPVDTAIFLLCLRHGRAMTLIVSQRPANDSSRSHRSIATGPRENARTSNLLESVRR